MNVDVLKTIEQIKQEKDYFQKARLILYLTKQKEVSIKDISILLGLKPSYVCHILRLNRLPDLIIDGFYAKLITLTHLFILTRIKDPKKMMNTYEKILSENLTVLQTEYLVREVIYGLSSAGERLLPAEIEDLISLLANGKKNTAVKLIQSRVKTKLIIEVKGNLHHTSEALRNLIGSLKGNSR